VKKIIVLILLKIFPKGPYRGGSGATPDRGGPEIENARKCIFELPVP
jgi:hypothetical protein